MDKIKLEGKKILVTGGNGYLGRNFIKKLIKLKAKVYSIDIQADHLNSSITNFQINLNNQRQLNNLITQIQPDVIYHLAASLNRTRDFNETNNLIETNLTGTINLLNALKLVPYESFILISTSEVYGGEIVKTPFREEDSFVPASPYSLSKYCAEVALKTYSEIYSKPFTILRLFNFFGKNMPKSFFIPQLLEKLLNNEDFDMTEGKQKRDFIYLNDVLEAMILANSPKAYNNVFNVCSGNGKSIKELALEIKGHFKSESNINFGAIPYRENEVWDMTGDCGKIKDRLGWQPKFSFIQGLQELIKKPNQV